MTERRPPAINAVTVSVWVVEAAVGCCFPEVQFNASRFVNEAEPRRRDSHVWAVMNKVVSKTKRPMELQCVYCTVLYCTVVGGPHWELMNVSVRM